MKRKWESCEWCKVNYYKPVDLIPAYGGLQGIDAAVGKAQKESTVNMQIYYRGGTAGFVSFRFCPFCGKPQTADAWDELMQRLREGND